MDDLLARAVHNLFDRIDGPMAIRLVIQPIVATAFALRDGLRDARQNRTPYGWSLFMDPSIAGIGFETAGDQYERSFSRRLPWMSSINSFNWIGSISAKR